MRARFIGLTIVMCVAVATGCGDDETGSGGAGGSTTSTINVEVTVSEFGGSPASGAEVCLRETSTCATTGADGKATIAAPPDTDVTFTIDPSKGHIIHGITGPGTTVSMSPDSGSGPHMVTTA